MKRHFFILGLAAGLCLPVCAVNLPFPVGEELVYKITWNAVPVAQATAVTKREMYEGRRVIALQMTIRTFAFFDSFFIVDNFYESLIDPETFLPIRYVSKIREKSYRCHESTNFDYKTMTASYQHLISGKTKSYDIKPETRDLISFMYFMRSKHLKENTKTEYKVMTDEKIYDLFLTAFSLKAVSLPNYDKKILSIELNPEASFDGLFVRKGKATVWISRDFRHLMTH
ncbi:MAG: DUF3108 domain-containing protein [Pontiellaceae bacterium]|nr:DUF3108 domain-containing protein [Pontiellaceae bacterium]